MKWAFRRSSMLLCAAAAMATACDGITVPPRPSTDVYDFRLRSDTFHIFHWPAGKEVRVFVSLPSDPALANTLVSAFEHGAEQWNAYALFGEYRLVRTTTISDADAVLHMTNDQSPVNTDNCPPVLSSGTTTFCLADPSVEPLRLAIFPFPDAGETESDSNVKMLVTIQSSQALIPGRIERLVAHELGHVLGIGQHSSDQGDLMVGGLPTRSTLSRRDIATIQVLYHTVPDILP